MSGDAQQAALLKLLDQMWNDPKVGASVRHRAKELNPGIQIPDDHPVAVEVRNELSETQKRLQSLEKMYEEQTVKSANRDAEAKLRTDLSKAQTRFNLTDDGMAGTIKLMQERQISDPEAAAALYVDSLPKQAPTVGSSIFPAEFNLFGTKSKDDQWEALHTNPDKFFEGVVKEVFSEMPA